MSSYEEGGGESSGTDVASCQCPMCCNFDFLGFFSGAFDFSFLLPDVGFDISNT